MRIVRSLALVGLALALAAALPACRSTKEKTYNFDPDAHERAVVLKSDILGLIGISGEPYSRHRANVDAVTAKLDEAYELAAAASDNEAVTAAYAALKDPSRDLYAGFVGRWRASGSINEATRNAVIDRMTPRLDYLLCLEAAKRTKAGRCTSPDAPAPEPAPETPDSG